MGIYDYIIVGGGISGLFMALIRFYYMMDDELQTLYPMLIDYYS